MAGFAVAQHTTQRLRLWKGHSTKYARSTWSCALSPYNLLRHNLSTSVWEFDFKTRRLNYATSHSAFCKTANGIFSVQTFYHLFWKHSLRKQFQIFQTHAENDDNGDGDGDDNHDKNWSIAEKWCRWEQNHSTAMPTNVWRFSKRKTRNEIILNAKVNKNKKKKIQKAGAGE